MCARVSLRNDSKDGTIHSVVMVMLDNSKRLASVFDRTRARCPGATVGISPSSPFKSVLTVRTQHPRAPLVSIKAFNDLSWQCAVKGETFF